MGKKHKMYRPDNVAKLLFFLVDICRKTSKIRMSRVTFCAYQDLRRSRNMSSAGNAWICFASWKAMSFPVILVKSFEKSRNWKPFTMFQKYEQRGIRLNLFCFLKSDVISCYSGQIFWKKKSEKQTFYDVLTQEQGLVPFRSKCM